MDVVSLNNLDISDLRDNQFAEDVLEGLCASRKSISAKYFYDDKGSELFQQITQHEDYYLTRAEFEILNRIKTELPAKINSSEIDIIELGAGDGHKTDLVLQGFLEAGYKVNYYPIDISSKAMTLLEENISKSDNLKITGVVGEYFEGLRYVRSLSDNKILAFFLGSNIGNFNKVQCQVFLRKIWSALNHDDNILIGFDLKKVIDQLIRAYNDEGNYTKQFNLNLLSRINNELGANFNLNRFQHFGTYNPLLGAMESFLISTAEQSVYIKDLERTFSFKEYESIHLEYSFKFLRSDIAFLSEVAGFKLLENFTDQKEQFIDSLWQVQKGIKN